MLWLLALLPLPDSCLPNGRSMKAAHAAAAAAAAGNSGHNSNTHVYQLVFRCFSSWYWPLYGSPVTKHHFIIFDFIFAYILALQAAKMFPDDNSKRNGLPGVIAPWTNYSDLYLPALSLFFLVIMILMPLTLVIC